jgi:hypothetical protein
MMSTRVQLSYERPGENFTLGFDLKEESLGEIFDKLEIMLVALGFVLDGKMLNLVDKEDASVDNSSGLGFLAEDSMTTTFTIHPGGKV